VSAVEGAEAGGGWKAIGRSTVLTVAAEHRRSLEVAEIRTLDDLFAIQGSASLTKANLPKWRQRIRAEVSGVGVAYLKRYDRPPLGIQLKRILSGGLLRSMAGVEWDVMRQLAGSGIGSVRGMAFAEERVGPWERRSAVLAEEVPGQSLEQLAHRDRSRWSRFMVGQLARFVAAFHGSGYVHRDLYLCHVFADTSRQPAALTLIDVARVFKPVWRKRRWVVKDLASLNYSTPAWSATLCDRVRFLRAYLGVARLQPGHRPLVRSITAKTQRIARHDRRSAGRGEPR
jgi:heptose I phosphotransferase